MSELPLVKTIHEFENEYESCPQGVGAVPPRQPATKTNLDNIGRLGDCNPLWRNENHAAKRRFGMITAQPAVEPRRGVALAFPTEMRVSLVPALWTKLRPMSPAPP